MPANGSLSRQIPAALFMAAALSGCLTDGTVNIGPQPAGIIYKLPRTDAKATLTMTMVRCDGDKDGNNGNISVDASVSLAAAPSGQASLYRVTSDDLASARIKRKFSLKVDENGVISMINSANTDQTPAIIGNILKGIVALAPILLDAAPSAKAPPSSQALPACKADVRSAAERVAIIKQQVTACRSYLLSATHSKNMTNDPTKAACLAGQKDNAGDMRPIVALINRLAQERVKLEADFLTVATTADITLEDDCTVADAPAAKTDDACKKQGTDMKPVDLDWDPFERWFGKDTEKPAPGNLTARQAVLKRAFGLSWAAKATPIKSEPSSAQTPAALDSCSVKVRVPKVDYSVGVDVTLDGTQFKPDSVKTAHVTVPVAQFDHGSSLCLDAKVASSWEVTLNYDKYGRTTQFDWNSDARAANMTAMLSGSAPDVASLAGTIRGPAAPGTVAQQKSQIDALQTQKTLNELLQCKAIIEAGGFDCTPASP